MKTSLPSLCKGFALLAGFCFCQSVTAQQEIVQNGIRFSLSDDGTAAAGEVVEIQNYSSYVFSAENWQPVDRQFSIVVPAYVHDADGQRYAVTSISERFTWTDTLATAAFVVFPSTVKSIDFTFMASHTCNNVVCGAATPPAVVNPGSRSRRYALFVPQSSIKEYTAAWKEERFHSILRVSSMYTFTTEANEDGTLTITKLNNTSEFFSDIAIPQQIGDVPVTKVQGNCFSAYNIIVPEGITEITRVHPQTTEIFLPSSLKAIPLHLFHISSHLLSHLKYVHLSEGLESIGEGAFSHCFELQQFTIPSTVNHIGDGQSCLYSIESFKVAEGNEYFRTQDGVLYTHDMSTLKQYPSGKTNSTFSVPEGVKTISAWGMEDLPHLRVLRLPASLDSIGNYALNLDTLLTEIHMGNPEPPALGRLFYSDTKNPDAFYTSCTLYVPQGSLQAYKQHDVFKEFKNIVEESTDGISIPQASSVAIPKADYDMSGRRVKNHTGITIRRMDDGTTRKILLRK